jgi:hypothetical protein
MHKESIAPIFEGEPVSPTDALNRQTAKEVIYWARFEGAQIRIDDNTVYCGADFPTDTNSADTSLAEIWKAWGERFIERIKLALSNSGGSLISILTYRGNRWSTVKAYPLL